MILLLLLAGLVSLPAQSKPGPVPDKVYIDVRMQEDIGLRDTAEGRTDVFFHGVSGPVFKALPAAVREKLEVYAVPSGSWSLLLNPVPNAPPYTVQAGGKTRFNPMAVREVRYALNWLINRKYVVDELLGGDGGPMFTPMTPGQPGTYRYNLLATRAGMSAQGGQRKALADIEAAMKKAAELPSNRGRLVRGPRFWRFDGEDLTLKMLIRVDDPNGRLKLGRYVADQIEKAGLRVERLEYDRVKCVNLAYRGNPADLEWQIYTEGWGAGATRAFWDVTIAQMYASYYGYMPGGGKSEYWNYKQDEIDSLSKKIFNGNFLTEEEYWRDNLRATELGLREACRVFAVYQNQYYAANRARFERRMLYGLGDGLNGWSVIAAAVKPEPGGERVLRLTQFSAKGSLFMSAWDPVGIEGFNDLYSRAVAEPLSDMASFESPVSALDLPLRVEWKDVRSSVERPRRGGEKLVGKIPVPADAILYDSRSRSWKQVGPGASAFSRATYSFKFGRWHSGRPVGTPDLLYAAAFVYEWMNKDGPDDRRWDAAYEKSARPSAEILRGLKLNGDGTITTYFDYNFPLSRERVAASGAPWLKTGPAGVPVLVSWEINEALAALVAEGGASGTAWSFSTDPASTEVDLLNARCVSDIRAKLAGFKKAAYVPPPLRGRLAPEEAAASYEAAMQFIDSRGHAYISNGPFYLHAFDPRTNFAELRAVRDPSYPFRGEDWPRRLAARHTRIEALGAPAMPPRNRDARIAVKISLVVYPESAGRPAEAGLRVKLTLLAELEKTYQAVYVKPGEYAAVLPAVDLAGLKAGSYTLVAESALGAEAPSVESTVLTVF